MGFNGQVAVWITAAVVLAGAAAQAGQCGYEYCWGALTAGPGGAAGRASGMRTAPGAFDWATKACGSACDRAEVFVNSCAFIVENAAGARHFGWHEDRAEAERRARAACEAGGARCRVRIWACSR